MFHINLEKYNTPYQQYIKKRFLDTLPDNDSTPENYGAIADFEWVLSAPEQYENEEEMMKYALENSECTIKELASYFDEITPPGLPPHAEEWDDDDDEDEDD